MKASSTLAKIAKSRGESTDEALQRITSNVLKKEGVTTPLGAKRSFINIPKSECVGVTTPAIVAVKFRREEIAAIDAQCQRNGRMSRAAWIRAAAHKALQSA